MRFNINEPFMKEVIICLRLKNGTILSIMLMVFGLLRKREPTRRSMLSLKSR